MVHESYVYEEDNDEVIQTTQVIIVHILYGGDSAIISVCFQPCNPDGSGPIQATLDCVNFVEDSDLGKSFKTGECHERHCIWPVSSVYHCTFDSIILNSLGWLSQDPDKIHK